MSLGINLVPNCDDPKGPGAPEMHVGVILASKPTFLPHNVARQLKRDLEAGMLLDAIDDKSAVNMSYNEVVAIVQEGRRPIELRFRTSINRETRCLLSDLGPMPPGWMVGDVIKGRPTFVEVATGYVTPQDPRVLPKGWDLVRTPEGSPMYIDRSNHNATQLDDPRTSLGPLPEGWEMITTPEGQLLFVHMDLKASSFQDPRKGAPEFITEIDTSRFGGRKGIKQGEYTDPRHGSDDRHLKQDGQDSPLFQIARKVVRALDTSDDGVISKDEVKVLAARLKSVSQEAIAEDHPLVRGYAGLSTAVLTEKLSCLGMEELRRYFDALHCEVIFEQVGPLGINLIPNTDDVEDMYSSHGVVLGKRPKELPSGTRGALDAGMLLDSVNGEETFTTLYLLSRLIP